MSRRVAGGDGRVWRVRRRWVPRLRGERASERFLGRLSVVAENLRGDTPFHPWFGIFSVGCLVPVGFVLLFVLVVVFVVAPLVVAIVELLVVLLLTMLGVAARVLFRRPWVVEAISLDDEPEVLTWRVVGWRASGAKVDEVADRLEAGLPPPAGHEVHARSIGVAAPEPPPPTGSE